MKNSKLKFTEYVKSISRSKSFDKFVLIVYLVAVVSTLACLGLFYWQTKLQKNFFFCQRIKGGNVILKRHSKLIHPNFSLFVVFLSYKNILSFLNSTNTQCFYKRRIIHQRKLCSTNNAQHLFSYILLHRTCAMINISRYCHNINQLFVYFCSQAFLPCHAS